MISKSINRFSVLVPFFFASFLVSSISAQNDKQALLALPDFSGIWELEKSELSGGISFGNSKNFSNFHQLIIKQVLPKIDIVEKILIETIKNTGERKKILGWEGSSIYYTDGRGEINKMKNTTKSESETKWKNAKLVTTFYSEIDSKGKREKLVTVELELSKDGKKLMMVRKSNQSQPRLRPTNASDINVLLPDLNNRKDTYKLISK